MAHCVFLHSSMVIFIGDCVLVISHLSLATAEIHRLSESTSRSATIARKCSVQELTGRSV